MTPDELMNHALNRSAEWQHGLPWARAPHPLRRRIERLGDEALALVNERDDVRARSVTPPRILALRAEALDRELLALENDLDEWKKTSLDQQK